MGFFVLLLLAVPAQAQTFPELTGRVVDGAGLLSSAEATSLEARLEALEQRTSDQVVVVTVADLDGETIESFGLRLGNHWGIGRDDVDNGVLLIVAPGERKTRIEVGLGLETLLTDQRAAAIIAHDMLPRFQAGEWFAGLSAALISIETILTEVPERPVPAMLGEAA